jgi:hypothetical protein
MQYLCPAPLPTGEEPRRKLRSQDYQPPAPALLENYLSNLSVGANEVSDPKVGDDVADWPEASSATRSGRKTRAATVKQSSSMTVVAVEAAKIAKLKCKEEEEEQDNPHHSVARHRG